MRSIRRHLTLTLLTTVPALATAAGLFLYLYARSHLVGAFDLGLSGEARALAATVVRETDGGLEFHFTPADYPDFVRARHPAYFEIWRADGSVLARSPSLGDHDLPRPTPAGNAGRPADLTFAAGTGAGAGRAGRVRAVSFRFVPRLDEDDEPPGPARAAPAGGAAVPPLTLLVARDRHELDETLWTLGSSLLASGVCLVGGIVLAVTAAVRRGLRPLYRLAAEADRIDAASLHHRFSAQGMPRELQPICAGLNGLLARLDEAFAREKRFASAAAHELRTPIAELRSLAEVALKWPDATDARVNFRDALAIARHMEAMVAALLCIARPGAGPAPGRRDPLDLGHQVREAWSAHEPAARVRGLSVRLRIDAGVVIDSDRSMLLPLVDNLLANAVAHTADGGEISCRVERDGAGAGLVVSNTCRDLTPPDLTRLFEPFWRKDPARSGGAHCGLGLSLVAAYAAALGASVRAELSPPGWFQVAVTFAVATIPPETAKVVL